jgi:murein L,D-transpeptidase YcbB/YkuD
VSRPLNALLLFWLLPASSALAWGASAVVETGPDETIAAAVEATRSGGKVVINGDPLGSVVVLPDFYERRGFRPAWTSPAVTDELVRAIRESSHEGLDPADYHLAAIERLLATTTVTAASQGRLDLLLTDAALRLAYHLRFGKVDPVALDPNWNMETDLGGADPVTVLQQAIDRGRIHQALEELKPRYPFYTRLKRALADYQRIAAGGGWGPIPAGGPLKPGVADARVPLLRRRLGITGDLPGAAAADPSARYDAVVKTGVRALQERHGLPVDGAVGPATLHALNVPVTTRIDQIRATLERCRWVMHDLPERFVLVNVAAFTVAVVGKNGPTWESRVVVGKPYTMTPIFRADMRYVVLNPAWNVPPGINAKRGDPGDASRSPLPRAEGLPDGQWQVIQPPGPNNP